MKKIIVFAHLIVVVICTLSSMQVLADTERGGTIDVAVIGEADTFDPMISTKDIVATITQHIYETLYVFDATWQLKPLLAKTLPEVSTNGKLYTIALREGIEFHDGSLMNADDVVASLTRWLDVSPRGRNAAPFVEAITAINVTTIQIKLHKPYSPLLSLLAFNSAGASILPQEAIGKDSLKSTIGTGPYMISEHKQDRYLRLKRFERYISPEGEPSAAAGRRMQVPDEIRFIPVNDTNTRVEGLLSGQFNYAESISTESFERLKSSDIVSPILTNNAIWPLLAFNLKQGILANRNMRKAIQYALPNEDMLRAAVGAQKFYSVNGLLFPKGHPWSNQSGVEDYNRNDVAKAREILAQEKYDGTPIRILTSHQYEFHFQMAEVAKYFLEQAGFKIKLDVVDWATLGQRSNNPNEWDIYISHSPFLPEPALITLFSSKSRVGWTNTKKEALLTAFVSETNLEKRQLLFANIQSLVFHDVPFLKVGTVNTLNGQTKTMSGVPKSQWPIFWNAKMEKWKNNDDL